MNTEVYKQSINSSTFIVVSTSNPNIIFLTVSGKEVQIPLDQAEKVATYIKEASYRGKDLVKFLNDLKYREYPQAPGIDG